MSATISDGTGLLHVDEVTATANNVTISNTGGSANGSTSVTISASGADAIAHLNAALASFTYTAGGDLVADTITVSVNDGNDNGVGGHKIGSASLAVITAPNDIPVVTAPVDQTYYYTANNALPAFSFTDAGFGEIE